MFDPKHECTESACLSRRGFLGAAASAVPFTLQGVSLASGSSGGGRDALVKIFLRGGMDGLTAVVPHGDGELYNLRPTLAVPPPSANGGAHDLDGFFGLAPSAEPLLLPWNDGKLAFVHASGSPDPTRSHFFGQRLMETGTPAMAPTGITSGWVARHLQTIAAAKDPRFRGIALNPILPRRYSEGPGTLPVPDPAAFAFPGNPATAPERRAMLEQMYAETHDVLREAASSTLATIDVLAGIDFAGYQPSNGAVYPDSDLGAALRSVAATLKADVGLEVANFDYEGWDHHSEMGPLDGALAGMLADLSASLQAFYLDMRDDPHGYVLTVSSEFGRRAAENGTKGTDHGRGNVMFVMGERVNGGVVHGSWPGLDPGSLVNGDLAITTDYRDVFAEILAVRLGSTSLAEIFPSHTPTFPGIVY